MRKRRFWEGEVLLPLLHDKSDWDRTPPTLDEIAAFRHFLDRLDAIEKHLKQEYDTQRAILDERITRGDVTDYEIEFDLQFFLKPDDVAFGTAEDQDNMLCVLKDVSVYMLCSDLNWNIELDDDYPLMEYRHPYMFHQLALHARIAYRDLLRIGMIWTDVNVVVQRCYDPTESGSADRIQAGKLRPWLRD